MIAVRVMIFLLVGLLVSSLFSYSIDYNNYLYDWYLSGLIFGSDPVSRLFFYVLKVTNLPIEAFIVLPYCLLCFFVRKNRLHLMIAILLSYSVMFNSLITVRVFLAVMFFMMAILLVFKEGKISFKTSVVSLIMVLFSIFSHLSLVLFLPIYLVALISWTRSAVILTSIFVLILAAIFYFANIQSLLQSFYYRAEYAGFGSEGFTFSQLAHLVLLIFEMHIMRIHLYKYKEKAIFILLAYGLIMFLISVIFHSLLVSRVMHIYHLISLILIMRYTTGNSFFIRSYLGLQILMSFYMVNFGQIYFPGIRGSSLILIFSIVIFYYIAVHELLLQFVRLRNGAR